MTCYDIAALGYKQILPQVPSGTTPCTPTRNPMEVYWDDAAGRCHRLLSWALCTIEGHSHLEAVPVVGIVDANGSVRAYVRLDEGALDLVEAQEAVEEFYGGVWLGLTTDRHYPTDDDDFAAAHLDVVLKAAKAGK